MNNANNANRFSFSFTPRNRRNNRPTPLFKIKKTDTLDKIFGKLVKVTNGAMNYKLKKNSYKQRIKQTMIDYLFNINKGKYQERHDLIRGMIVSDPKLKLTVKWLLLDILHDIHKELIPAQRNPLLQALPNPGAFPGVQLHNASVNSNNPHIKPNIVAPPRQNQNNNHYPVPPIQFNQPVRHNQPNQRPQNNQHQPSAPALNLLDEDSDFDDYSRPIVVDRNNYNIDFQNPNEQPVQTCTALLPYDNKYTVDEFVFNLFCELQDCLETGKTRNMQSKVHLSLNSYLDSSLNRSRAIQSLKEAVGSPKNQVSVTKQTLNTFKKIFQNWPGRSGAKAPQSSFNSNQNYRSRKPVVVTPVPPKPTFHFSEEDSIDVVQSNNNNFSYVPLRKKSGALVNFGHHSIESFTRALLRAIKSEMPTRDRQDLQKRIRLSLNSCFSNCDEKEGDAIFEAIEKEIIKSVPKEGTRKETEFLFKVFNSWKQFLKPNQPLVASEDEEGSYEVIDEMGDENGDSKGKSELDSTNDEESSESRSNQPFTHHSTFWAAVSFVYLLIFKLQNKPNSTSSRNRVHRSFDDYLDKNSNRHAVQTLESAIKKAISNSSGRPDIPKKLLSYFNDWKSHLNFNSEIESKRQAEPLLTYTEKLSFEQFIALLLHKIARNLQNRNQVNLRESVRLSLNSVLIWVDSKQKGRHGNTCKVIEGILAKSISIGGHRKETTFLSEILKSWKVSLNLPKSPESSVNRIQNSGRTNNVSNDIDPSYEGEETDYTFEDEEESYTSCGNEDCKPVLDQNSELERVDQDKSKDNNDRKLFPKPLDQLNTCLSEIIKSLKVFINQLKSSDSSESSVNRIQNSGRTNNVSNDTDPSYEGEETDYTFEDEEESYTSRGNEDCKPVLDQNSELGRVDQDKSKNNNDRKLFPRHIDQLNNWTPNEPPVLSRNIQSVEPKEESDRQNVPVIPKLLKDPVNREDLVEPVVGCKSGHAMSKATFNDLNNNGKGCPCCKNKLLNEPVKNLFLENLVKNSGQFDKDSLGCPISSEVMEHPVIACKSGHSFELSEITNWQKKKEKQKEIPDCPCCRKGLLKEFVPNLAIKEKVDELPKEQTNTESNNSVQSNNPESNN